MLRIIKNYFWNIASIVLIIVIAESIYFYHKINAANEYKVTQQSKVKLRCEINMQYPEMLGLNFCINLNKAMLAPINSYVLSFYALKEKDLPHIFKLNGSNSTYTIKFEIENFEIEKNEKIKKFNEKDFEDYILNKAYKFFDKERLLVVNQLIYNQIRLKFSNYISEKFKEEFSDQYPDFFNEDEIELLSDLQNQHIKDIQSYIKIINNININEYFDVEFEYNLTKETIKTKFKRLNYINVLLISLLLGIYLNLIVIILMENSIKKN